MGAGDDAVIAGFIAQGTSEKRILVRGLGPSLADKGVTGALADPVLELYDGAGNLITTNDNWMDNSNQQEIIDTGIAPTSASASFILTKVPATMPGAEYTAVMRCAAAPTGAGLI